MELHFLEEERIIPAKKYKTINDLSASYREIKICKTSHST